VIGLDWSPDEENMALAFQDGDLRESFGQEQLGRSIHDDTERSLWTMLTEQDDGLPKIRVAQSRTRDQKDTFIERGLHTVAYRAYLITRKIR